MIYFIYSRPTVCSNKSIDNITNRHFNRVNSVTTTKSFLEAKLIVAGRYSD